MPKFETLLTPGDIERYTAGGYWPDRIITDYLDAASDAEVRAPTERESQLGDEQHAQDLLQHLTDDLCGDHREPRDAANGCAR